MSDKTILQTVAVVESKYLEEQCASIVRVLLHTFACIHNRKMSLLL